MSSKFTIVSQLLLSIPDDVHIGLEIIESMPIEEWRRDFTGNVYKRECGKDDFFYASGHYVDLGGKKILWRRQLHFLEGEQSLIQYCTEGDFEDKRLGVISTGIEEAMKWVRRR